MPSNVELIKQKLDLVEFLKSYVNLTPAGKNLKTLCPFHQERNPSFMVSPERQVWHCFGCDSGGDLIKFVMLYENLEFPEALRFLAEKAGIDIGELPERDQRQFAVLVNITDAAKKFYIRALAGNEAAKKYLRERGLLNETVREFELGYSPGGDELVVHLLNDGYRVEDVVQAGVAYKVRGLYRDRFGDRIIFPIVNDFGKTVGFTGRIFQGEETDETPKYVNSPETPIFNKSKLLYGLSKSKPEIVKTRTAFLVEGQMDVIMAWQAGVRNVVGLSGTSLTTPHLIKLRRFADAVVVSFDNDSSGLKALERSLDIFGKFDFEIKAVNLGEFQDPAEACAKDPEGFKKKIEEAEPVFTYLFETYFAPGTPTGIAERKEIIRRLLRKIRNLKSSVEQDMWISELAEASGVAEPALKLELEGLTEERRPGREEQKEREEVPAHERIDLISRRLLVLSLAMEEFLSELKKEQRWLPEEYRDLIENPDKENVAFLELESSYLVENIDDELIRKEFASLLRELQIESLKRKQVDLKEKMRVVREDERELLGLAQEFHTIARQIDKLKKHG